MNIPTSPSFFRWKPAAWLRVTGGDAAKFLQGQFSNDVAAAAGGVYGLWLNVKGKVVADSFVIRGGAANEFWVGSYFSAAAIIREKLESFIIADDVVIEDATGDWMGVTLVGAGAGAAMAQEPREGFVFSGRRGKDENSEWVFPVARTEAVLAEFAARRELTTDDMSRRRIAAGIPAVPADLGPGDLPTEGGLDEVAVSYTKGCYLGQEVIARLKSMGQVRRRLLRVAIAGEEFPRLPAALFLGARQVGELRSAVRDGAGGLAGLAMLSLLHVKPPANLALVPHASPIVRVETMP